MAVNLAGAQTQSQFQQPQQQTAASVFGLASKLDAFGGGGEYFDKLYVKTEEKIKILNTNAKSNEKYGIHKLIKTAHGLNYSGIVVSEKSGDLIVAHILSIERTGDYPTSLFENINGQRVEIIRTPADALDLKYIAQAQKLVAGYYGVSNPDQIIVVDGTLVPNEYNVDNDTLTHDLFINTINALDCEVNIRNKTYQGINIPDIVNNNRNGKFVVNMYFNNNEAGVVNEVGLPIRQDVCVTLSYKLATNTVNRSVNQGTDTVDIIKVFGYIDIQWVSQGNPNNPMNTQKFIPNFIITRMESAMVPTPDITLLALVSILAINEDMNWMQAFRATPAKKGDIDFNDIGALNIEGNIENNQHGFGTKIETKTKEFNLSMLNTLVSRLVYPNLIISIDVAQASPDTWYENVFFFASTGTTPEANSRILAAAASLTNGMTDAFNHVDIFSPIVNKIHGGYYKTKDGIRDIRHLSSYLAVANYVAATGQDPKILSEYTNSLYAVSIPPELRAAERKKLVDNMSNNTAVYKQFYNRLTFSNAFIVGLVNSLRQVGFAPVFGNMMANNDMFFRRATADFSSAMLGIDTRLISNVNSYSNMYQQQGYNRPY